MKKINVFCLPFAGGNKYAYKGYSKHSPSNLNVVSIEIPGRGGRFKEKLLTNIHDMADDVFRSIKYKLHEPYAIYGHSMGTLLGYLVTKKIIDQKLPPPLHLFISGSGGPIVREKEEKKYLLPKKEFVLKLKELDGSPDEILNDEQMIDFFEPIIRADFEAVETYKYQETTPFNIPIDVFIGLEEKATYEEALTWQNETTSKVEVKQFLGKHFFIFNYEKEIIEIISNKLNNRNL